MSISCDNVVPKAYIDAISAMESTTVNMQQATPKKTQIAPAGPPFRSESVPVLATVNSTVLVHGESEAYTSAKGHVKPTIAA